MRRLLAFIFLAFVLFQPHAAKAQNVNLWCLVPGTANSWVPCSSNNPLSTQQSGTPAITVSPLGYCQLSSLGSATSFTSCSGGIPAGAKFASVCIEGAAIRWRDDGTAPTSGIGMPVNSGQCFYVSITPLSAMQIIQQAVGGIADVSFYNGTPLL